MNKSTIHVFIIIFSFIFSGSQIYWDLGVGISSFNNSMIEFSTMHRIEGLKKYYANDFNSAIYHFSELDETNQQHILYEHIHSYYLIGEFSKALDLLSNYQNDALSDNLIYLKSKIFTVIGNYKLALDELEYLKTVRLSSDYSKLILFDIEKINLLIK